MFQHPKALKIISQLPTISAWIFFFLPSHLFLIQQLHVWHNMCASTYTLNFNSLLNIINATQLPDQLSLGIHRHWRGRADSMRCSTTISEFVWFFLVFLNAAAAAARTKQLKWCRGRKASPAVLLCCSSWKLDSSQSPSEQKCHFFDVSI